MERGLDMRGDGAEAELEADRATAADYRRGAGSRMLRGASLGGADRIVGFVVGAGASFALAIQGGGYDLVAYEFTGLVVWWLIAAGLTLGFLPRARAPRTTRLPLLGLMALVAWTAISLAWTSSAEATYAELARLVAYAGMGLLALMTLHRGNWRPAAAGLAAAAVAVSGLSVLSRIYPAAFAGTSAAIVIDGRLSYPLGYWNALGAWSAMALVLALGWSGSRTAPIGRRLALAAIPTIAVSIYLTYSRGALVGLAIALIVLFALYGDRRELVTNAGVGLAGAVGAILIVATQPGIANGSGGAGGGFVAVTLVAAGAMCAAFGDAAARRRVGLPPWRRAALATVLACCALLVVGAATLAPGRISARLTSTPSTIQAPGTSHPAARVASLNGARPTIWRQGLDAFASRPLLGIGPGTFAFWWSRHEGSPAIRDAHSLYLGTLADLGVPGLLALAAIILGLLAAGADAGRRLSWRPPVAAGLAAAAIAFCVQAAGDWLWQVPATVALATLAIVVLVASGSTRRAGPNRGRSFALAFVAVVAGAAMIPGVVSTQLVRDSSGLLASGQRHRALDYARAAVTAQPWSATAYAQLAAVEQVQGRLSSAREDAKRAIELEPQNWIRRLELGTIDFHAGRKRAALARLREAASLDSRDPAAISPRNLGRVARGGAAVTR